MKTLPSKSDLESEACLVDADLSTGDGCKVRPGN